MNLFTNTVGRKMVMAVTGSVMLLFVIVHVLGNSSIYGGPGSINTYAMKLKGLGPFVWIYRVVLAGVFAFHVFYGIRLTLEDRAARHEPYARKRYLTSTVAGRNMIWTGLVIGTFIVYHLIHFTFHIGAPGIPPGQHMHLDEMGRHDVFTMVVLSFGHSVIVAAYLAGISALGLHLFHGIQSLLQSLGLNNDRTLPVMKKTGRIAAALLYLAYIAIPLVIYIGILKPAVSNHGH